MMSWKTSLTNCEDRGTDAVVAGSKRAKSDSARTTGLNNAPMLLLLGSSSTSTKATLDDVGAAAIAVVVVAGGFDDSDAAADSALNV